VRIEHLDATRRKGWYAGPWDSDLQVSIGYAAQPPPESHCHLRTHEVYLVARGWCEVEVASCKYRLREGDALVLSPGEVHCFLLCSNDYLHFVLQSPGLGGEEAVADKQLVTANGDPHHSTAPAGSC